MNNESESKLVELANRIICLFRDAEEIRLYLVINRMSNLVTSVLKEEGTRIQNEACLLSLDFEHEYAAYTKQKRSRSVEGEG